MQRALALTNDDHSDTLNTLKEEHAAAIASQTKAQKLALDLKDQKIAKLMDELADSETARA